MFKRKLTMFWTKTFNMNLELCLYQYYIIGQQMSLEQSILHQNLNHVTVYL